LGVEYWFDTTLLCWKEPEVKPTKINIFLRYCFDIVYSMPQGLLTSNSLKVWILAHTIISTYIHTYSVPKLGKFLCCIGILTKYLDYGCKSDGNIHVNVNI
jgi:hypothetical protein